MNIPDSPFPVPKAQRALPPRKPGRNELCACGSGLKNKRCHNDPVKIQLVNHAANVAMNHLIQNERVKKGIICEHGVLKTEHCASCKIGD